MKRALLILAATIFTMTACTQKESNPFLGEWDTPYGIPQFDQISYDDYIPAIQAGIEQQDAEIKAITDNPEAPTFENTIAPLELSGSILARVGGVLYNISETDQTPELDSIQELAIPMITEHENNISFNKALYERIAAIYNADQSNLTREQQMVLKNHFESFEREGIGLSEEAQAELRTLNTEMASKIQKVGNNILAENNAFKEKFGFSTSEYVQMMTTTEDRELRQQYNQAYRMRGHNGNEYDNGKLVLEILQLRQRKAAILGYPNWAEYILAAKMAHDAATVDSFLEGILKASEVKAVEEIKDMQAIMDEDIKAGKLAAGSKIEQWDWWYYAEKVRKAKYDLDDSVINPYFKIDNVVKGIFIAAKTLYGINAEKIENVPSYNPECVTTYKITAEDGSLVGIFTTDYHPRSSKRGGAWMNNIRDQYYTADGQEIRPIIVNVGNLPEYLGVDDVQTVFHEFGHALHGLLTKCHYRSISGTSVKRDFVEMFSQFNENWAFQPELLAQYAMNENGEVIPAELVEKINAALKFNQGFMTTELAAASALDMKWHELTDIPASALENPAQFIDEFENNVRTQIGLNPQIEYRYRTTYFNHIFSSGYDAGYYGYLWAEVLDKDAFSVFTASENGPFDLELAKQFKETFLEKGGSEEPMVLYKSFTGREPDSKAMLAGRGLL